MWEVWLYSFTDSTVCQIATEVAFEDACEAVDNFDEEHSMLFFLPSGFFRIRDDSRSVFGTWFTSREDVA
jgi:hypothetical protein